MQRDDRLTHWRFRQPGSVAGQTITLVEVSELICLRPVQVFDPGFRNTAQIRCSPARPGGVGGSAYGI